MDTAIIDPIVTDLPSEPLADEIKELKRCDGKQKQELMRCVRGLLQNGVPLAVLLSWVSQVAIDCLDASTRKASAMLGIKPLIAHQLMVSPKARSLA